MSTYLSAGVIPATKRYPQRLGSLDMWQGKITHTASYATNGDTLQARQVGMNVIEGGIVASTLGAGGALFEVLPQTDGTAKIRAIVMSTGAEVANTTNLSALVSQCWLWGH
jgi:hypothetical protein